MQPLLCDEAYPRDQGVLVIIFYSVLVIFWIVCDNKTDLGCKCVIKGEINNLGPVDEDDYSDAEADLSVIS